MITDYWEITSKALLVMQSTHYWLLLLTIWWNGWGWKGKNFLPSFFGGFYRPLKWYWRISISTVHWKKSINKDQLFTDPIPEFYQRHILWLGIRCLAHPAFLPLLNQAEHHGFLLFLGHVFLSEISGALSINERCSWSEAYEYPRYIPNGNANVSQSRISQP